LLGLLFVEAVATTAHGQLHRATDPVATPPSSLIEQDDALAIDLNPAALGLLPSWSLGYLHSQVDYANSWLGNGDAFFVASPLLFNISGGLSVQSIRPGDKARQSDIGRVDRGMVALALAFAPSRELGVGLAGRVLKSGNARIDNLATTDLGAAWRPAGWLGVSLVGRDLLATRSGFGTGGLELGPSALLTTAFRPLGTRDVTVDFGLAVNGHSRFAGRAGLSFALPYVGSASALAEVEGLGDRDALWRIVSGLTVQWGRASAAGGVTGSQGSDGDLGWYALLRFEGTRKPGVPTPRSILNLEINDASPLAVVEWTLTLDRAVHDPAVAGVLLRPRSTGMGLADAQELRALISALRVAGKRVVCHVESASGPEYYACATANRILIDPAGSVRIMGTSMTAVLIGDTLEKIGVRVENVRIGDYKSAAEQLTQGQLSEPAREEHKKLLDDVHGRMVADLAIDLRVSEKRVAEIIDSAPYLAPRAISEKLVSAASDEFTLQGAVRQVAGDYPMESNLPERVPRRWGVAPRLGVVVVDGGIIDGDNVDIPLLGMHFSGGRTVVAALEALAADPTVGAILLRVDSSGGSAFASDQIWRAVRRARERKPVIASMGAIAASGGYLVACAADEIWVDPATLTGSIGIFAGKVDVQQLAKKVGLGVEIFQKGRFAAAESIWRPYSPDERAELVELIRTSYRLFLQRVSEGRGLPTERVHELGQGRVYSGQAALRNGLADREGGLAQAMRRARQLANLPSDAEVVLLPERKFKLWDFVLGQTVNAGDERPTSEILFRLLKLPSELRHALGFAATVYSAGGIEPLALMPHAVSF
jgi:protease-4